MITYLKFRSKLNGNKVTSTSAELLVAFVSLCLIIYGGPYVWWGGIFILYPLGIQITRITFWTSIRSEFKMTNFYDSEVDFTINDEYLERNNGSRIDQMLWGDIVVYYIDDFRICILGKDNQQFYFNVPSLKNDRQYEDIANRLNLDYHLFNVKDIEGAKKYNNWVNNCDIRKHIDDLHNL